jgi:hypothetical protein
LKKTLLLPLAIALTFASCGDESSSGGNGTTANNTETPVALPANFESTDLKAYCEKVSLPFTVNGSIDLPPNSTLVDLNSNGTQMIGVECEIDGHKLKLKIAPCTTTLAELKTELEKEIFAPEEYLQEGDNYFLYVTGGPGTFGFEYIATIGGDKYLLSGIDPEMANKASEKELSLLLAAAKSLK